MIDNLPYYTEDIQSIQNAYSNNLLEYVKNEELVNKKTGELYYSEKRRYLNLTLIFIKNNNRELQKLTIRGSIHKVFNSGLHNANNFTFKDFETTLKRFSKEFGIDLTKCNLLPPEYGNNLPLSEFSNFDAREIVLNAICEQRKIFQENVPGIETSKISGSSNNEMRFKLYTKSDDYPKYCENNLRVETQQKKMRDLHKNNIEMVSDLFNINNQIFLFEKHLEYIKNIVLFDYTIQLPKKSKYRNKLTYLKDSNYWRKLIKDCKNKTVYNTKYNEEVALLNYLSKKYGSNILEKLIQHTKKQWIESLGICNYSTLQLLKKPKNARVYKSKNALLYNTCIECNLSDGLITTYHKKVITTKPSINRICPVTGVDISMQKGGSHLLSNTGLKYYEENKPIYYKMLVNTLLTGQENEFEKTIYDKLSKQIRNRFYNKRNNYNNNQLGLSI